MTIRRPSRPFVWTVFAALALAVAVSAAPKDAKKPAPAAGPLADLSLGELKLRSIGPALTSGRISDFAVNPADRSEFYVASSSGGVWKTVNAGTTFAPVFDGEGSYSIGCVALDPKDPNVVWVGTGENNNQRSVAYGDGVYKSVDGGATWKNVGLKTSEHIGMIRIDPRDSDVVYVAAYGPLWSPGGERGLYKTADGGATWTPVLTVSENTGVSEVHLDPHNPDVLYAVAHQRRRHVFTYLGGGPESAVHKSRNGGKTWDKAVAGLPSGDLGRIGLAVSPVVPNLLYAIVEGQERKGGFYRSTNGGATWERRSGYTSAGNYYQELVCDPKDPDRVYSMDVFLQVTDDGGATWRALGDESKHWDSHALWIDPSDTDDYLNGNDGGVYESFDRGRTWKYMPNLPVTQFYKVTTDNDAPFYNVYGGTQDNYSLGGPSRTTSAHGIVNADWYTTDVGDGFESAVDPEDPNIIYAQSQHGYLARFDRRSGESMGIQPKPRKGEEAYRWNWDSPLLISPHSHTRLYFAANKVFRSDDRGDSWTVVSGDLTRRLDRNALPVMGRVWPMDAVAKNQSTSRYGNIVALDESPVAEGLLYAGTDDGLIQVSEDGGANWRRIASFPGVPDMTYVNDIIASHHDRKTVYACFNNHKRGDFKPYVLKSADLGRTWTPIASDLPERGSVYALAEDHLRQDLLFAGTEFGLFVTLDGGKRWKKLSGGLPTIAVRDLAVQKRENDLVLATFGRGFYILDDYSPLRELSDEALAGDAAIFPVKDALMFVEKTPLGTLGSRTKGFQGESYFTAPNPPVGAVFTYYLKDAPKKLRDKRKEAEAELVKAGKPVPYPSYDELKAEEEEEDPYLLFTIADEEGRTVRELRAAPAKGLRRIVWDLRYADLDPVNSADSGNAATGPSSTFALPGDYEVSLALWMNGALKPLAGAVPFKAKALTNVSLPAPDRAALVAFQKRVRELAHAVNAAGSVARELRTRAGLYRTALKSVTAPSGEIFAAVRALEDKLAAVGRALNGDRLLGRADRDAEPGLSERINTISGEQWTSTSAPTKSQRDSFAIVEEAFAGIRGALKKLLAEDIPAIDKMLDAVGAPYTPGRLPDWK
ncbi:MAG: glycosyl hydrolase [Candidatus Aminicenantes bacterium]|nr:glycosyl hydrolase [Candidatus Aminicenantes bacterium]